MLCRVVYGETLSAWEKSFATKREADAFAKEHESFGDKIFSIKRIDAVKNPGPHSLMSSIQQVQ